MRQAVAGYPENGDLLALWLSSEEFTSLLRNHGLQSDAKFCALAFSFSWAGFAPSTMACDTGQRLEPSLTISSDASALSSARALARIEKWVDLLSGPKL